MLNNVLITGGAGFIGSHLAEELLSCGCRVRVLDDLSPQVHGPAAKRPAYLNPEVELVRGDIRNPEAIARALSGIDAVFHFVAAVGVGQSMYQIAEYTSVNNLGTALLLEALSRRRVERLIVASSMSVYGEGLYRTSDGTLCNDAERSFAQLRRHEWDPRGEDLRPLTPLPTPESKPPSLASIYALSKFDQERMCLMIGRAYGVPTVALRFFNVYGPYQALSNPYTGVLTNFASRLLNGNPPLIFEDGEQRRDFISVYDIARGCALALDAPGAPGHVINLGTGRAYGIRDVATRIAKVLGRSHVEPRVLGRYRAGDIRHCFADITRARTLLGFEPQVELEQGISRMAEWLRAQHADDNGLDASAELEARGLIV